MFWTDEFQNSSLLKYTHTQKHKITEDIPSLQVKRTQNSVWGMAPLLNQLQKQTTWLVQSILHVSLNTALSDHINASLVIWLLVEKDMDFNFNNSYIYWRQKIHERD